MSSKSLSLLSLSLSLSLMVASLGCAPPPFEAKDVGGGCAGLEATCSTDGGSILVCDGDVMVVDDTCADGCSGSTDQWFSTDANQACCDSGGDRECISTSDSDARQSFRFDDDGSLISG